MRSDQVKQISNIKARSVGKLLVGFGIYQALADLYPNDLDARWRILRDTQIIADVFIISDHHTVRMWDRQNEQLIRRPRP